MRTPRKRYTVEFKLEAIRLAESSNKPMAQIEQELGITNGLPLNRGRLRFIRRDSRMPSG
jgi:transposase-like protein